MGTARSESLVNIQSKLTLVNLGVSEKPLWMVSKSNSCTSGKLGKQFGRSSQGLNGGS